jgi:NADH-quinone oxidoreductase subunit G
MAAVPEVQTVNITINDIPLSVPKGELIVESAKRVGLEIPIFCYHPRMKPVGMCRMCLIEIGTKGPDGSVRMMPKPQTACSLPATEGLVVYTDSEKIHQDRRGVLEFLLINHPLDCPICDRGGECPLQNNTLFYGPSTSRFIEVKRHAPKAFPLSNYVTLDLERCIQCGRCVRFTEEISGDAQLAFRFRGASMQPSTFELRDFTSKFSGNVIEICPVGALTSSEYRFRARPWDLQTKPALCTNCGNGCNIYFDYRGQQMVRVSGRTNEEVNEEWTCDRGKFGHGYYNSEQRLSQVLVRAGDRLTPSDWPQAYAQILRHFAAGAPVAAIGGAQNSNEDIFMFQRLFRSAFGSHNLDHRTTAFLPTQTLEQKFGQPFKPIALSGMEGKKAFLLFGTSLSDEQPILYLRVRKAWLGHGAKVVVAHYAPTDADEFASVVLRYKPGTEEILAAGLASLSGVKGADSRLTASDVAKQTGVSESALREAAEALKDTSPAVITTHSLRNSETGIQTEEVLASLAISLGGSYDCLGLKANDAGAALLGMTPSSGGMSTQGILEACVNGVIKALWILGMDPFNEIQDKDLLIRALENVDFLVVQDVLENQAMPYASVVLPMNAPAEAEGTWTNIERRVQHFGQVIPPRGDAKAAWQVATELAARIGAQQVFYRPADVMDEIAKEIPAFAGCAYPEIGDTGFLLN